LMRAFYPVLGTRVYPRTIARAVSLIAMYGDSRAGRMALNTPLVQRRASRFLTLKV
jgi:hypothetical protein